MITRKDFLFYDSYKDIDKSLRNCLYILELDDNIIKIGRSVNPRNRIYNHHLTTFKDRIKRIAILSDVVNYDFVEEWIHGGAYQWFVENDPSESFEIYRFDKVNSFDWFIDYGFVVMQQVYQMKYNNELVVKECE